MANRKPNACDNLKDMERKTFRINEDTGSVATATINEEGPLSGIVWDSHKKTVNDNIVTFEFFSGGLTGTLLATATLTYADTSLCDLQSSEWVY